MYICRAFVVVIIVFRHCHWPRVVIYASYIRLLSLSGSTSMAPSCCYCQHSYTHFPGRIYDSASSCSGSSWSHEQILVSNRRPLLPTLTLQSSRMGIGTSMPTCFSSIVCTSRWPLLVVPGWFAAVNGLATQTKKAKIDVHRQSSSGLDNLQQYPINKWWQ